MWQNWLNVILGVWLILSPWIFGYVGKSGALWNSVIVGILVAVLAYGSNATGRNSINKSA